MKSTFFKSVVLATAIAFVLSAAPTVAQAVDCEEEEAAAKDKKKGGKGFHIEERNGQRVYVIDKEITVCGKVPRLNVALVLLERSINYQWENLKRDFLPKVLQSVRKAPF